MTKSIRSEAADLLACLASQPEHRDTPHSCPGHWSWQARALATESLDSLLDEHAIQADHTWAEIYAEAESRLRAPVTRRIHYDVIIRRFLAGWSISEVCERLECSEGDGEQAIHRAMNRGRK